MSLLMDALKKAEQAKLQGSAAAPTSGTPELALEASPHSPAPSPSKVQNPPRSSPSNLPELPKLEDLDEEFMAHARQSPANTGGARTAPQPAASASTKSQPPSAATAQAGRAERQAIRNAFAVKQTPSNNHFALIAGAGSLLAIAGIGIYFWLQLKPTAGLIVQSPSRTQATASAAATGSAGQAQAAQQALTPPVATPGTAIPAAPAIRQTSSAAPPDHPDHPDNPDNTAAAVHAKPAGPRRRGNLPLAAEPPLAAAPIRVASSQGKVNPAATEGYEAFQAGNLAAARRAYERLLQTDPWNRDGLHGMAAIALREDRTNDAEALYARLLEANPRDAQAQAGMLGIRSQRGQGDPVTAESHIKSLLTSQPESAALQFALGNLYARQSRWSEAQQAYFQALTGDAGNPDYLFNLAVSLDQLHQAKLAGQYYRQALAAAESRPAAFDREQAASRLRELQP